MLEDSRWQPNRRGRGERTHADIRIGTRAWCAPRRRSQAHAIGSVGGRHRTGLARKVLAAAFAAFCALTLCPHAHAIDFYEIQIYPVETTPPEHLQLELHSNSVTTATGQEAQREIHPYQIHETLEATYGILPFAEIGQYFCTARLDNGNYEYAGSRTKLHFGVPGTENWWVALGGNIELDYMRRAAEEDPLTLELRPIAQTRIGKFTLIGNFAFGKPFRGTDVAKGFDLEPSGEITYDLFRWITPAVEYYGDMGPIAKLPAVERQQHFIVPAVDLHLDPRLELNLGVGFGLTRASNGTFVKSIIGWAF